MGHGSGWVPLFLALALTALSTERLQTKVLSGTALLRWLLLDQLSRFSQRAATRFRMAHTVLRARPAFVTLLQLPACSFLAAVAVIIDPVYWWLTCSGVAVIFFARQFALAHSMGESETFDQWCSSVALSPDALRGWAGVAVQSTRMGFANDAAHQTYLSSPFSLDPLVLVCLLVLHLARLAEDLAHPLFAYAITCVALAASAVVLLRSLAHVNTSLSLHIHMITTKLVTRLTTGPSGVVALGAALASVGLVLSPAPVAQQWALVTLVSALALSFLFRILASILAGSADPHCILSGNVMRARHLSDNGSPPGIFLDHLELGVHRLRAPTRTFVRAYAQWEQSPLGASLLLFRLLVGLDLLAAVLVLVVDMPVL